MRTIEQLRKEIDDAEGHSKDKLINEALQELEKRAEKIKVFGSYPKGVS